MENVIFGGKEESIIEQRKTPEDLIWAINESLSSEKELHEEGILETVQELWRHPKTEFGCKLKLIKRLIGVVTYDSENDDEETRVSSYLLEHLYAVENNFFLHAIIEDFLNDGKKLNYSLEERKGMISRTWSTVRDISEGNTYFVGLFRSIKIPRVVEQLSGLTDDEIMKITNLFIEDDLLSFGPHGMRQFGLEEKMENQALSDNVVTRVQLDLFDVDSREDEIDRWRAYCYDLNYGLASKFTSKISRDMGVLYDTREGGPKYFFSNKDAEKLPESKFRIGRRIKSISSFLVDLKQSRDEEGGSVDTATLLQTAREFEPILGEDLLSDIRFYLSNGTAGQSFDEIFRNVCAKVKEVLLPNVVDEISLEKIVSQNTLLSEKNKSTIPLAELYEAFSSLRMRSFMEDYFGFSYAEISIATQLQFLNYVWDKDVEEIEKVKKFVQSGENTKDKVTRFNAFLYCEYGEHLGGLLFEIDEKFSAKEAQGIFAEYDLIAQDARSIGKIIEEDEVDSSYDIDKNISSVLGVQLYEAFARRAKDILYTISEVSHSGEAKALFFGDKEIRVSGIEEPMSALSTYCESISKIEGLLGGENNSRYKFNLVDREDGVPASYRLKVHDEASDKDSYLTIQLRAEGTNERNTLREFDGEARINFLFSEVPIELDVAHPSRQNAVSIRLDREGKTRAESGNIVANDPTRKDGEVSLDLGSLTDPLGRTISVGNALSKKFEETDKGQNAQYYHNRESFSRTLGDAETFKSIVELAHKKLQNRFN